MENRRSDVSEHESACARVAAQFPQLWLRCYVGSKLRCDPIYSAAYERFRGSAEPILDIGCGLGLLAFYLRERACRQPILGLDLDARKIRQGNRIAAARYSDIDLRHQDIQGPIPVFSGNIALFDVLHYLPPPEQTSLLSRLAQCVAPEGLLVIRDCPRDNSPRFWMTYVAEKFAQAVSWNLNTSIHFPPRERIAEAFNENEFERESRPLWGTSPFNNQLFIFRRRASATVPAGE
jgi:2-polyprenyl-3-methyl-5-hydroxy-6-metoxy-1,4-benzoquinol methylase